MLIPAYNAVRWIGGIVSESRRHLADVFVVDDGSVDGTGEVAAAAGAVLLRHEVNRGKGAALKTGFARILADGFDAVITLDADGQHLPAEIPRFAAEAEKHDAALVIGSRRHLFPGMVKRRRLANSFSAWTISAASRVSIPDSQSGFRLYTAELLRRLRIDANGFDAESEVIVRAGRMGFRIVSIPIELGFVDGVATSHYRPLADTIRIAFRVVRTVLRS